MTKLRIPYLLAAAAIIVLVTSSLSAFVLLSPVRTWDNPPTYIVDNRGLTGVNDGNGGVTRVINAITSSAAWNNTCCGNVVNAVSGSMNGFQLGDGVPMLNLRDPTGQCNGSCLAATFTGFIQSRGDGTNRYTDADIVTNANGHSWTSQGEDPGGSGCNGEIYIEGVQVHEVGHGLGLGHTNVGGATMFPSVSSCNNGPATTASDDIAGLDALYGGGGGGTPANSCSGRCGGQAPAGCWCDFFCIFFGDCCPDRFAVC